jgi:hypothetical protein
MAQLVHKAPLVSLEPQVQQVHHKEVLESLESLVQRVQQELKAQLGLEDFKGLQE